jgi:hypothetical protein
MAWPWLWTATEKTLNAKGAKNAKIRDATARERHEPRA